MHGKAAGERFEEDARPVFARQGAAGNDCRLAQVLPFPSPSQGEYPSADKYGRLHWEDSRICSRVWAERVEVQSSAPRRVVAGLLLL